MIRLFPLALVAVAAPTFAAPGYQSTVALDRAVASFTGHAIGEDGGARDTVDARLKLASCPTLALAWRNDAHDAVVVSCTGPEWRVFVPVRSNTPPPAARAAVAAAAPVRAEPVIRRGDPVTIEAGASSFSITREGVAMADAAPGARFLVRVEPNKAPVQAVAVETGRATLPGW